MAEPDQHFTPYEKGRMTGLSMAQGDGEAQGQLDGMMQNMKLDADYRRGLLSGKMEAQRLESIRALDEMLQNKKRSHKM